MKEHDEGIPSMKGYPKSRQRGESNDPVGKKKSVVGSIKDRIQQAIKQSKNERYNREAIDAIGGMEFNIAKSGVDDRNFEREDIVDPYPPPV